MPILTQKLNIKTGGHPDLINITDKVEAILKSSKLKEGNVTIFVVGSTAGILTFEYEPGLIKDVQEFYEEIIPSNRNYHHDDTWGDANGFSHIRAALQGPSLTIPFENNKLLLGTWQQIVLAEFDHRPRNREIIVQIIGE